MSVILNGEYISLFYSSFLYFPKNTSKVHLFIISDSFKRILTWPSKEFAFEEKNVKFQLREKSVRGYLFLIQFFVSI